MPMVTYEANQDQIRKLAAYLRHNPGALSADPETVARECGVTVDLVRRSFTRSVTTAAQIDEAPAGPGFFERFRVRARGVFNFFDRYIYWSISLSVVSAALAMLAVSLSGTGVRGEFDVRDAIAIAVLVCTVVFHLLLYFRRGLVRVAFMGALVVWLTTCGILSIGLVFSDESLGRRLAGFILSSLGILFMAMFYSGVGAASALMGAYRVVRHEEQTQKNRTRQQLIERMFEIEELLGQKSEAEADDRWIRRFLAFGQKNVWWLAIGTSAVLALLNESIALILGIPNRGSLPPIALVISSIVLAAALFVSQVILAFMGGRPARSILVSFVFTLVQMGVGLLPWFSRNMKFDETMRWAMIAGYVFQWGLAVFIGLFAGIGAQIEERSYRRKRLEQNDPQMLLAELIDIQRILNPDASTQFLMVVDAARSSVMKANADPMQAEWSFREYQMFLARIVESHGGRILSTAGDGAIAMFPSAASAFQSAREIQTRVTDFNQNVNRLKDPFRLRIGIHCDTVQADLTDVQFAAVIDIAAHVEGASQVGGIAVTQPVADLLPEHRFAVLSDLVDGYSVSMALNPTLDPEKDV